jgi:hypothetical protein
MKIEELRVEEPNSGKLRASSVDKNIEIKKGRYICNDISHPLFSEKENYFSKVYCLEYKKRHIYFLNYFGRNEPPVKGIHIGLTIWQNHKFLWLQNKHWLQKEENIRYIVNILFLIIGVWLSIMSIKK